MKRLDEVEPRTPVHSDDLPLNISNPGSYYLAEPVVASAGGITIMTSDVTIDLSGFSLRGGTGTGILAAGPVKNVVVRNGTVSGWPASGIDLSQARSVQVVDVRAEGNTGAGIRAGQDALVRDCTATANTDVGVATGRGSIVTHCTSNSNGAIGIDAGLDTRIEHCTVYDNSGIGIRTTNVSSVVSCLVTGNGGDGIVTDGASTVTDNTVYGNRGDGIEVIVNSYVARNDCARNGRDDGDGAGIHVVNTLNRIEANSVVSNDRGIDVDGAGNTLFKNSARDNPIDYDIAPGNDVGPIGNAATAASCWSNLSY